MSPLLSVIVPVYNAEKYLKKCLDSIEFQTLKNIEIIVINDGSLDNSKEILEKYVEKDERFILMDQINLGVSVARNKGLDVARGEYIGFVDSDDYIELDMYEKMYRKAKKFNADIVISNVKDIIEDSFSRSLNFEEGLAILEGYCLEKFLRTKYFKTGSAVWHKIFRRELVEKNSIRFVNYNEVSSEDTIFNLMSIVSSKRIYFLDEMLYNYFLKRENSLTSSSASEINMTKRGRKTIEIFTKYCKDRYINIEEFTNYLIYRELIGALGHVKSKNLFSIRNEITFFLEESNYSEFIGKLCRDEKYIYYFKNDKDHYSKLHNLYDKMFILLCRSKLYLLASIFQYFRLARSEKIQKNDRRNYLEKQ